MVGSDASKSSSCYINRSPDGKDANRLSEFHLQAGREPAYVARFTSTQ